MVGWDYWLLVSSDFTSIIITVVASFIEPVDAFIDMEHFDSRIWPALPDVQRPTILESFFG